METSLRGLSIGERVELRRRQRGLSRSVVAGLCGRSAEWLRQVEHGHIRLDSVSVIVKLAEVLRISDPTELVSWPGAAMPAAGDANPQLVALRRAVIDHEAILAFDHADAWCATWGEFRTELDNAWQRWCTSFDRYTYSIERVPRLLHSARRLRRRQAVTSETERCLGGAYRLARCLLSRLGEDDLALHAAYRALDLAERTADSAAVAACAWHVACCLLNLGHHEEARLIAETAEQRLGDRSDPEPLALSGALHLVAAEAAAAQLDPGESRRQLTLAIKAAASLGRNSCHRGVWFGPTETGIVGMQIALRLGRVGDVLQQAKNVAVPAEYPVERRSRYFITLALAHSHRADDAAAVLALSQAHRECPEELRFDQTAQRTLARLIRRDDRSVHTEVARLAAAAGI